MQIKAEKIMKIIACIKFWLVIIDLSCNCSAFKICTAEGNLCIPSGYNKLIRPHLNQTTEIGIDINDLKILKINDYDCTITLSLTLGHCQISSCIFTKVDF